MALITPPVAVPAAAQLLLSDRAAATTSSAIRDLLEQAKRPGMISLAGGLPDSSQFPATKIAAIAARLIEEDSDRVLQYGVTQGDDAARQAMAGLFDASVAAEDIVITTGSQQGLDLIARTVVNPGDQVVVGDPDYLGALQVFAGYGAALHPIKVDAEGLDTGQLEEELRWGLRPKCLYLVPHFHNPTGATMSADRRSHLDRLSTTYGFLIIEDDPYRELFYNDRRPMISDSDPALTVRLRSTSKTLTPGLRVGALSGPPWLNDAIVTAKQSADLHTSTLTQAIVADALSASWCQAHLLALRTLYATKRDALVGALRQSFGSSVSFDVPAGGMFLWARFDHVDDTTEWLTRCLDAGTCFVPGAAFGVSRDLSSFARLSFATGSVADLDVAVQRMQAVS